MSPAFYAGSPECRIEPEEGGKGRERERGNVGEKMRLRRNHRERTRDPRFAENERNVRGKRGDGAACVCVCVTVIQTVTDEISFGSR